jgi:hypothetical protein
METQRTVNVEQAKVEHAKQGVANQLVHPIESNDNEEESMKFNSNIIIGVYIFVIALGIGTGYVLSTRMASAPTASTTGTTTMSEKAVGSTDTKTFKDSAEGVIEAGGANGEGSHKLIREGGPSQTAYLISSVVDLDEFVGKKVKVWGQTMAAKKVSWLMDVGSIEPIQ